MDTTTLDTLADLLAYPGPDHAERVAAAHALLDELEPAIGAAVAPLDAWCREHDQGEIEELYTRCFDLNPSCALELGWHLYGEDYDRGAFLVTVRDLMRRHGVEETGELPDHVTHILRLIPRLEEDEAGRFARRQALPALARVRSAFGDANHPYVTLVAGAERALAGRFGPADDVPASAFACAAPYDEDDASPHGGMPMCGGFPQPDGAPPPASQEM